MNMSGLTTSLLSGLIVCLVLPWSVHLHAQTDTLWTKIIGIDQQSGKVWAADETADGGFILTGSSSNDLWLVRTDSIGNVIWSKTFDRGMGDREYGTDVRQTNNSGFIIAGATNDQSQTRSKVWLIRTDEKGDTLWTKTFEGGAWAGAGGLDLTADDGYIISATASFGSNFRDVWLIKTDAEGNLVWTSLFIGQDAFNSTHTGGSIRQTVDGGYVLAASTGSTPSSGGCGWVIRTDDSGTIIWETTLCGKGESRLYSVKQTNDRGFVLAGSTTQYSDPADYALLIKLNANGDMQWQDFFGGNGWSMSVDQTHDNGYVIIDKAGALWKTNGEGELQWSFDVNIGESRYCTSIQQLSDSGFLVAGWAQISDHDWAFLARLAPDSSSVAAIYDIEYLPFSLSLHQNYPNPFNPVSTIRYDLPQGSEVSLIVYDILGREVARLVDSNMERGYHQTHWDGRDQSGRSVPSGIYIARLVTPEYSQSIKMALLK